MTRNITHRAAMVMVVALGCTLLPAMAYGQQPCSPQPGAGAPTLGAPPVQPQGAPVQVAPPSVPSRVGRPPVAPRVVGAAKAKAPKDRLGTDGLLRALILSVIWLIAIPGWAAWLGLMTVVFPKRVQRARNLAADGQWGLNALAGVIAVLATWLVLLILKGVPVLALLVLLAAAVYASLGVAAHTWRLGESVLAQLRVTAHAPAVFAAAGGLAVGIAGLVPLLGTALLPVVFVLGYGAAVRTWFAPEAIKPPSQEPKPSTETE